MESEHATSGGAAEADADPMVLVGEVTAPFGVRGQVKIRPLLDDPKALIKLPAVTIRWPDNKRESRHKVRAAQKHGSGDSAILTFDGIADRDTSETMRGALVFIRKSELPPLGEDTYYQDQLVGLAVITESGRDLGVIEQVLFYPANDVYETPVALIPAVADVVVRVDLAEKRLIVRDIPGLRKDE